MARFPLRSAAAAAFVVLGAVCIRVGIGRPADAAAYGQHLRECAQTMGFDQHHNPGMHKGITRWDPAQAC